MKQYCKKFDGAAMQSRTLYQSNAGSDIFICASNKLAKIQYFTSSLHPVTVCQDRLTRPANYLHVAFPETSHAMNYVEVIC